MSVQMKNTLIKTTETFIVRLFLINLLSILRWWWRCLVHSFFSHTFTCVYMCATSTVDTHSIDKRKTQTTFHRLNWLCKWLIEKCFPYTCKTFSTVVLLLLLAHTRSSHLFDMTQIHSAAHNTTHNTTHITPCNNNDNIFGGCSLVGWLVVCVRACEFVWCVCNKIKFLLFFDVLSATTIAVVVVAAANTAAVADAWQNIKLSELPSTTLHLPMWNCNDMATSAHQPIKWRYDSCARWWQIEWIACTYINRSGLLRVAKRGVRVLFLSFLLHFKRSRAHTHTRHIHPQTTNSN